MNVKSYIQNAIQTTLKEILPEQNQGFDIDLTAPKQKDHGDLATNIALVLGSQSGRNPRQLASEIVNGMDLDPELVARVDIAGPGFINFTFSDSILYEGLKEIVLQQEAYGTADWGGNKKTQIEFVSANPTGPLTIGHGRQAVLGDTVARLLEATGHDVTREYYFNDAGRQMRVLADSVRLRYLEQLGMSVEFPDDYYQGDYIRDIARELAQRKGASLQDEAFKDDACFRESAEKAIFDDIRSTLERMGIHFDVYYNEKSLYETGKIDAVIKELRKRGLAYDQDGAVWLKATDLGLDQDRVIVKSTGEPTYRLPDLAYHRDKIDRGFDIIIDIFGADHIATYPDVLAGMRALGYDDSRVRVLIHQFVTLTEGREKIKMSTRKANFVTLDELMDEVGVDVTRYFFLNRSASAHLNFDLTLAKTQSDENPVYYIQYAHARICSILRHAEEQGYDTDLVGDPTLLTSEEELELIKILLDFPRVVSSAAEHLEPHRLPTYLENVATTYHRFQHAGKVDETLRVVSSNRETTQARLDLCRATRIVLANGLDILGISRPERM
ncbi:arginine--tRNA ligase [bacterium]|nr:arginine--tRNA ligase [bacterium]